MLTKVCGLTDIKETKYLKDNNVDFAGMVLFYEKSKRNITVEKAKEIIAALHDCDCQNDVEAVSSQSKEDLILACENALYYFGGAKVMVPLSIVPFMTKFWP